MRWPTTKVWVVTVDEQRFKLGALPGAILCRLGLHRWMVVETKTIREIYDQSPVISKDSEFNAKRLHRWQCRRDFCAAEFDAIYEQHKQRRREEDAHAKFLRQWMRREGDRWLRDG